MNRKAAPVIEASDLDYTILRSTWLKEEDIGAYGKTRNGAPPFRAAGANASHHKEQIPHDFPR